MPALYWHNKTTYYVPKGVRIRGAPLFEMCEVLCIQLRNFMDAPYSKREKGSGQKGHTSLSPRLTLCVTNQIAEPQSLHHIAGMQTAPFVLCTLVISWVAVKEAAEFIVVMKL